MIKNLSISIVCWLVSASLHCEAEEHLKILSHPKDFSKSNTDLYIWEAIKDGGLQDFFPGHLGENCSLRWLSMSSSGGKTGGISVNEKRGIVRFETSVITLKKHDGNTLISISNKKIAQINSASLAKDLKERILSGGGVPSEENVLHSEFVVDGESMLIQQITDKIKYIYVPAGIIWRNEKSRDFTLRSRPLEEITRLKNVIAQEK